MENRQINRPHSIAVRGRRPLGDLTSQLNNHTASNSATVGGLKQGFTIYQDNPRTKNDENVPQAGSSKRFCNDENAPPRGLGAKPKTVWPEPPPPSMLPSILQREPLASSSPADHSKFGIIRSERNNQNEKSILSPKPIDDINIIDPYTLVSRSSAADFKKNNDSISSVTTNEDEDCDSDLEHHDDQEMSSQADSQQDQEAGQAINLSLRIHESLTEEYALDILKNMIGREVNYLPKWNYMTKQPDITFTMRSILIDWLIEVGEEYKLQTETLFLAVNYIDRFLSYMSVQRAKLQLVGTACMFIAAKYEEIYPPDVTEFCYITDDTYTKRQVLRMEQLVLGVLNFECAPPTAHWFVNHIAGLAGCTQKATFLSQYLTELTLIDGEAFMPFSPSIVACASVALSRHTLGLAAWEDHMVAKTKYNVEDFKECLIRLHETFENAPTMAQQAVREKYKNAKYESVSDVTPTPIF